ncbi:MAG: hypothetical protein H0X30_05685 [Anaerolineae bacterium]|nr:hypothetical protein [Anaerolineae bacterium]
MPTPFTHLETAQRMLVDGRIPSDIRSALALEKPAFLLGNVAADARTNGDLTRESTHFYTYDKGITEHPWRVMVQQNPSLLHPTNPAHRVFVAGYVAHLTIDETWSLEMLGPHFVGREWASNAFRFLMLHMLLISMDERDYSALQPWQSATLASAEPDHWLPFMNDHILDDWRDFISEQISAEGHSQTLEVLGKRINKTPAELRAMLDSQEIQSDLWGNITPDLLATVETSMYQHACEQLCVYWNESQT